MTTTITFSLHAPDHHPCFTDTARDVIRDIRNMSTQTKHRLELTALVLGLTLSILGFAKGWFILPDKVDRNAAAIVDLQARRETDRELLLKLSWQYDNIDSTLKEIKEAVKAQAETK